MSSRGWISIMAILTFVFLCACAQKPFGIRIVHWIQTINGMEPAVGETTEVAFPEDIDVDAVFVAHPYLPMDIIRRTSGLPDEVCRDIFEDIDRIEQMHIYFIKDKRIRFHGVFGNRIGITEPGCFFSPYTPGLRLKIGMTTEIYRPLRISGMAG